MPDRRWLAAATIVGILAVAACTTSDKPSITGSAGPTSTSRATVAALPPRPKEIPVQALDPCGVLTKDQLRQLEIDRTPVRLGPENADRQGNRGCDFGKDTKPYYSYRVVPVPQEGADAWLTGERNVKVKQVQASGFGAVETRVTDKASWCNVVVDVAKGQSVDVQFSLTTNGAFTTDQMCEKARQAAEMIMQNLSARS